MWPEIEGTLVSSNFRRSVLVSGAPQLSQIRLVARVGDRSISHRRLAGAVRRRGAVEVAGAFFEGADHAADRFAEQDLDQPLQQT
jgi:hypothetical protein